MKAHYPNLGLARICVLFGVTRQAYYQYQWSFMEQNTEETLLLILIKEIRYKHPRLGGRKLYELLQKSLSEHEIKMGRDALFDLLSRYGLLVRKRKRRIYTTQSFHHYKKHSNLIKNKPMPIKANEIWVSDITYLKTANGFVYVSFITDAYSRKIVGYYVADTLEAVHSIEALKMALSSFTEPLTNLIHHSDRGVQYCCDAYVKMLEDHQIQISMTESGDPLDNAIAERVNGILKDEYLLNKQLLNLKDVKKELSESVKMYNTERPHMSINMLTPNEAHQKTGEIKRVWKNGYVKTYM
jgi:putative transposase